jgi:tyrosyl-tRNA synthetase
MDMISSVKVVTDPAKIDEFLSRGVENIYPNKDFLRAKMLRGERLSMYLGIDPTGSTLHLGHAIIIQKLAHFQALGHQAILLIGDFTATIGDPTDKTATRKKLTKKEVLANAKSYKKQASTFLKFSGSNKAKLVYNSKWLSKMRFSEVLDLASKVTVDQMLKRDMFEKRMQEMKPLYIHEIMYPLLQGYDSVAMNVDGEIGGNDQTFNMLMGRDLSKNILNKEKFVISTKLLVDPSGKKMGKTEGNMVSLDQTAPEMFGKILSWTDALIIPGFELCTSVSVGDIADMKHSMDSGANPRDFKIRLAKEIVAIYHGVIAAAAAEQNFTNAFKKGELPKDAKKVSVKKDSFLVDTLLKEGLVESKGDFRRLVENGAVSEVGIDAPIHDFNYKVERDISLRIGKKRFIQIHVEA